VENPGYRFAYFANRSRNRQLESSKSANTERETVVMPLPISIHAGQIIMLTKMMISEDLCFYEFEEDVLVKRWRSDRSD